MEQKFTETESRPHLRIRVYEITFTVHAKRGVETRDAAHSRLRSCLTHYVRQRWSKSGWKGVGVYVTRPQSGPGIWITTMHCALVVPGDDSGDVLKDICRWGPAVDDAFSCSEQTIRDKQGEAVQVKIGPATCAKVIQTIPFALLEGLREVAQQFADETNRVVRCPSVGEVAPAIRACEVNTTTVSLQAIKTGRKQ